jgi:hypothetical protein
LGEIGEKPLKKIEKWLYPVSGTGIINLETAHRQGNGFWRPDTTSPLMGPELTIRPVTGCL